MAGFRARTLGRKKVTWDERSPIEMLMTCDGGYAIDLMPTQRAICRVIDGVPLGPLWDDADVKRSLGAAPQTEWMAKGKAKRPFEVCVCAGIRGGKTMIAAATAIHRAIYCDLSWWRESENPPIVPLLATRKHNAHAAFSAITRLLTMKGAHLGEYYVGQTADTVTVRHHSEPCEIEIMVMAGSRAGSNLESYWLASCVFDEAFKMSGRESSTINLEDAQVSVRERIVQGGQILYIGSPWAPEGPAYQMVRDHWAKPSSRIVVMRAPGPVLNPVWWDERRLERLKKSTDKRDRENYITSGLGEFLDPEVALLSTEAVSACMRKTPAELPPQDGVSYFAAMDPATKRNAWTLMIGSRKGADVLTVDVAREWMPTARDALDPAVVLAQVAEVCRAYRVERVWTDQYAVEALRSIVTPHGLALVEHRGSDTWELYDPIRVAVQSRTVELPPDEQVRLDLTRMRKRATATGMRIVLPTTADGRHCDYAPALALLLAHAMPTVTAPVRPLDTDETLLLASLEKQGGPENLEELGSGL